MPRIRKNSIKGKYDETGTIPKVESPGQFRGVPEERVPAPETYLDIEHGHGPVGLRRLGKKFLHIKRGLRKKYDRGKTLFGGWRF